MPAAIAAEPLPAVAAPPDPQTTTLVARAMGGRLVIHLAGPASGGEVAVGDARRTAARVAAWARLLTRHEEGSPLARLNDDPRPRVPVPPTLGAALAWAADAERLTGGLVDATRLDERLRAEGRMTSEAPTDRAWRLVADGAGRCAVERAPGLRFDLDGVGKGWLADRALGLLRAYPGALVDADGDIAVRVAPVDRWEIGVADPRDDGRLLAIVVLPGAVRSPGLGDGRWGVATSGTSVHRFGPRAHHLIDPRTGEPAATDVVQATVIASGAAVAEALAKSAVILGSAAGLASLEQSTAAGAILLLDDGRVLALPRTTAFLG